MTVSPQTTTDMAATEPAAADPWDEFYDDLALHAWQPALRFALDADHAAQRCRRRACKLAGACRMTLLEGEPIGCGGGLSDDTLADACGHVLFGCIMVRRFAEDIGLSLPDQERQHAAVAPRRAISRRRRKG